MLNLAPIKYRSVGSSRGGPVTRIEYHPVMIDGRRYFQANAYLDEPLRDPGFPKPQLYDNCDGTGIHPSRLVAQHIAISEAIERWAYYSSVRNEWAATCGFSWDETTAGMAAFPGVGFPSPAAVHARRDALERFALMAWWCGELPAATQGLGSGVTAVNIHVPKNSFWVSIVHREVREGSQAFHTYGFGGHRSLQRAQQHARLERWRNQQVLRKFYRSKCGAVRPEDRLHCTNLFERRCLYFSTAEGYAHFQERLSRDVWKEYVEPEVLFDGRLEGPWERYAQVWHCALNYRFEGYLQPHATFFYW